MSLYNINPKASLHLTTMPTADHRHGNMGDAAMALLDFADIPASQGRERSLSPRRLIRFTATSSALSLGMLLAASPASAAPCQFAALTPSLFRTCFAVPI